MSAARSLPVTHPDAELLAVCAILVPLQAEWQRLYDATSEDDELTTPADHAWRSYSDHTWPGLLAAGRGADRVARLATLPATTAEGLRAKAAAILAVEAAAEFCGDRDDSIRLALSVVRDAAALGVEARP